MKKGASYDQTFKTAPGGARGKPQNRTSPAGNTPLLVLTHHLSPGGGTFTGAMPCVAYEGKY